MNFKVISMILLSCRKAIVFSALEFVSDSANDFFDSLQVIPGQDEIDLCGIFSYCAFFFHF